MSKGNKSYTIRNTGIHNSFGEGQQQEIVESSGYTCDSFREWLIIGVLGFVGLVIGWAIMGVIYWLIITIVG